LTRMRVWRKRIIAGSVVENGLLANPLRKELHFSRIE